MKATKKRHYVIQKLVRGNHVTVSLYLGGAGLGGPMKLRTHLTMEEAVNALLELEREHGVGLYTIHSVGAP
jgi:hypothetical protein